MILLVHLSENVQVFNTSLYFSSALAAACLSCSMCGCNKRFDVGHVNYKILQEALTLFNHANISNKLCWCAAFHRDMIIPDKYECQGISAGATTKCKFEATPTC